MSILIKGLDIPKKGELQQDELILRITPDGEVAKYDKLFGFRNRYKAVDISPHGRLIDADKLDLKYCGYWADKAVQEAPTIIESDECAEMKKLIKLILEVDTEDDVSVSSIERDLMQEINCASYSYKLKKCEVIEAKE